MPAIIRDFERASMQPVFFALLQNLVENNLLAESDLEVFSYKGTDVYAYARHGLTQKVVSVLARELKIPEKSGRKNERGGELYSFYRNMRPLSLNPNVGVSLQPQHARVPVSKRVAGCIVDYVMEKNLHKQIPGFEEWRKDVQKAFESNKISRNKSEGLPDDEKVLEQHRQLWSVVRFPEGFVDTVWRLNERTDAGICQSYISFQRIGRYIVARMKTIYKAAGKSQIFRYHGVGGTDGGRDFLEIQMFRVDHPHTYLNLILQLDSYNDKIQQASVGQMLYFAIRFRKYVTKMVVAERTRFSPDRMPDPKEIFRSDRKAFMQINKSIRRYLYEKLPNRLPMPDRRIDSIDNMDLANSLQNWVADHLRADEIDGRLRKTWGDYVLVYFDQKGKKQTIDLKMSPEDASLSDFICTTVLGIKLGIDNYYGRAEINSHTILQTSLVVPEENAIRQTTQTKTSLINLQLKLPVTVNDASFGEKMKSMPHFGYITGLPDPDRNMPTAYKCLVIEKSLVVSAAMLNEIRSNPTPFR